MSDFSVVSGEMPAGAGIPKVTRISNRSKYSEKPLPSERTEPMTVAIIVPTWGIFIVHEHTCPTREFDWTHHGQHGGAEYEVTALERSQIIEEMRQERAPHQSYQIFSQRVSFHWCTEGRNGLR